MSGTISSGGTGRLVMATVVPFARENLSVRASIVKEMDSGARVAMTGTRLRLGHLLSIETTSPRGYVAACKDLNDVWSEWGQTITFSASDFAAGSTNCSIGSAVRSDSEVQEPAVKFPDLSLGSGVLSVHRTIAADGFFDETRRSKWILPRAAFRVELENLDQEQVQLMQRFFTALNGPVKPFLFDFVHPVTGQENRYVVRFRDPQIADELQALDLSHLSFTLIEVVGISNGGNA